MCAVFRFAVCNMQMNMQIIGKNGAQIDKPCMAIWTIDIISITVDSIPFGRIF